MDLLKEQRNTMNKEQDSLNGEPSLKLEMEHHPNLLSERLLTVLPDMHLSAKITGLCLLLNLRSLLMEIMILKSVLEFQK